MATLQSGKCFTVPTFFGMCCRSEWQERMYIYKWHEVDQTKHEIFCGHIVCNEIQVKVNLEITTFFFYLRFPYCPNFFWFGVVDWTSISPEYYDLREVFSKQSATKLPPHRPYDCAIDLLPGTLPPRGHLYSLSAPETKAMNEDIQEALRTGFIRPSTSPASAAFLSLRKMVALGLA